jgi:hypothetical protein
VIPSPPLTEGGELAAHSVQVRAQLVPGLLSACGVCGQGSAFHWRYPTGVRRFVAVHAHCVHRLVAEWLDMVASARGASAPAGMALTGAYARRRAVTAAAGTPDRGFSSSLGSPYFRPGMLVGAPWVAVASAPGVVPLICPAGCNEGHAWAVALRYRARAVVGLPVSDRVLWLATEIVVVGPDGVRDEIWQRVE